MPGARYGNSFAEIYFFGRYARSRPPILAPLDATKALNFSIPCCIGGIVWRTVRRGTNALCAPWLSRVWRFFRWLPDAAVQSRMFNMRGQYALMLDNLSNVHISQDRNKGVITLTGTVPSQEKKLLAENAVKQAAPSYTIADEIAVTPPPSPVVTTQSDTDIAIQDRFNAEVKNIPIWIGRWSTSLQNPPMATWC